MSVQSKAVFLSYASQDAEAAKKICAALRSSGIEVWFDRSELRGGDAWDAKIRKQIKECALFVPVISANTQARREGYFRIEWKLAAQRTHAIAEGTPFLLPLLLDGVPEAQALVPSEFREVQWTALSPGSALEAFAARVQHLANGSAADTGALRSANNASPRRNAATRWNSRRRLAVAAGVFVALGAGLVFVSGLGRSPNPAATMSRSKSTTRTAALAGRPSIPTRDELDLAVERARRETEMAMESAAAWSKRARLESQYILRGWDVSSQRRQDVEAHAKRALAIDPGSIDAMFALAIVFLNQGAYAEAETLMRRAVPRDPTDAELLQALGSALSGEGRAAEALAVRQEALRLFPENPFVHYDVALSYEQATPPDLEAALRKFEDSMALQPLPGAVLHKVSLLAGWRGDLAGAQRLLDTLDPLERTGDRAVGIAMTLGLLQHEPDRVIKAGGLTARSYFDDDYVRGPKAWLLAQAYAQAGKPSLAVAQWREAEAVLRQRLGANSQNWYDRAGLAITLAWLGERPEAASILASAEAIARESAKPLQSVYLAYYYAGIDDAAMTAHYLQPVLERREMITGRTLPLDPWWDKVRGQPEFVALLKEYSPASGVGGKKTQKSGSQSADAKSVVVLPFANLSGDPEQEYFSDGLTEEILNALARERDLRVPGRASAFSFKGKNASAAEIAKALNVSQLVEGSVRKSGKKVRISVQLTRASDGFSEALPTVERELTDIFALQDEVARLVVEKLTKRATTTAPVAVLTAVPEAYDAYLRGRALQTKAAGLRNKAAAEYERAVSLDPKFALAWARLAEARFRDFGGQYDRSPKMIDATRVAIEHALAARPDLPEALIVRANWERAVLQDYAAAERDLARAAGLQPPTAELRMAQAGLARERGQTDENLKLYREAVQLDPENGDTTNAVGLGLSLAGLFAEADRYLVQSLATQGAGVPLYNRLNARLRWRGPEAALRLAQRAPNDPTRPLRETDIAKAMVHLGRLDEARAVYARLYAIGRETSEPLFALGDESTEVLSYLRVLGLHEIERARALEWRYIAREQMRSGNGAPFVRLAIVRTELALGNLVAAAEALREWRDETAKTSSAYRQNSDFARHAVGLYAQLGRPDEELALLRQLQKDPLHRGRLGFELACHPALASLRNDPRFLELVREEEAWAKSLPDPTDP